MEREHCYVALVAAHVQRAAVNQQQFREACEAYWEMSAIMVDVVRQNPSPKNPKEKK